MNRPSMPPDLASVLAGSTVEQWQRLHSAPLPAGYPHWESVRHKSPPAGLTVEEWWAAIQLQRSSQRRPLPLKDVDGREFSYVLTEDIQRQLHEIDSAVGGTAPGPRSIATPENRDRYVFNSLVEEAITSSQLEGASTTRQVAADMIRYERSPQDVSEQMILNNYHAMQHVRAHVEEPLSMDGLMNLHRVVCMDTMEDETSVGRIQRPDEERVSVQDNVHLAVLHAPPAAELLPQRLEAMIRFANEGMEAEPFLHPVLRAITLHFWLAYEHPFADGNGRTARALFYWSLLRQQYRLFEFVSISRILKQAPARYGRAFLHTETDSNDLTYFFRHQLDVIDRALRELADYLARKREQMERVEFLLKRSNLNHRQIAMLSHAVRHPGQEYTIKAHQRSHGVAYATARADLLELANERLLEQAQRGRKTLVFIAPRDLEARLEARA